MSAIRTPAKQKGIQSATKPPKLKKFHVLYNVQFAEWYEIDALDEDDAEERAYSEGSLIRSAPLEETACQCDEVES